MDWDCERKEGNLWNKVYQASYTSNRAENLFSKEGIEKGCENENSFPNSIIKGDSDLSRKENS